MRCSCLASAEAAPAGRSMASHWRQQTSCSGSMQPKHRDVAINKQPLPPTPFHTLEMQALACNRCTRHLPQQQISVSINHPYRYQFAILLQRVRTKNHVVMCAFQIGFKDTPLLTPLLQSSVARRCGTDCPQPLAAHARHRQARTRNHPSLLILFIHSLTFRSEPF